MGTDYTNSIILGGGCFWCLHSAYSLVRGVTHVLQGYAGGVMGSPSYEDVSSGKTGHAEVVMITFDTRQIQLAEILDIFWTIHDPTTPNRQGADIGTEYRSIILYSDADQKRIIKKSYLEAQKLWNGNVVTEISPLSAFYPAEKYHYGYEQSRPDYCNLVINPKLAKLRQKFASKLINGR